MNDPAIVILLAGGRNLTPRQLELRSYTNASPGKAVRARETGVF